MRNWNESEYVRRAKGLAEAHVVSGKGLNDLAEKIAREESLTPDEIRTLTRLTNVATFQEKFARKNDGDKLVEFEPGDPEVVIQRIVTAAAATPETANINNDKLAHEVPDLMREVRLGRKFDEPVQEKVASDEVIEKPVRYDMAVLCMRKLAEDFEIERLQQGNRWERTMTALGIRFKTAGRRTPDLGAFLKDAWAAFGDDAFPELTQLHEELRLAAPVIPSSEKLAELSARHLVSDTAEHRLLTEAVAARHGYTKIKSAQEHLKATVPGYGE